MFVYVIFYSVFSLIFSTIASKRLLIRLVVIAMKNSFYFVKVGLFEITWICLMMRSTVRMSSSGYSYTVIVPLKNGCPFIEGFKISLA